MGCSVNGVGFGVFNLKSVKHALERVGVKGEGCRVQGVGCRV